MPSMDNALPFVSPEKSTTGRLRPVPAPPWLRGGMRVASALAPGAAARVARRLFFTPLRARVRDEERAVLARGERFEMAALGGRVVGRAWGEGPAMLLAHGWGGHAGQMTPLVDPIVAAGYRAVALDLPGHGESEGRVSSLVHFASALARAASLFGPVHGIAAHSFGAAGSAYAMASGLMVKRAAFFAPPVGFESFWLRFRIGVGVSQEVMDRLLRDAEAWLDVRLYCIAPGDVAPRMTPQLLVLHAGDDREVLFKEGAELARRWPGTQDCSVEGLGDL